MTEKEMTPEEPVIVTIEGPDGSEADYAEAQVLTYEDRQFAVLVEVCDPEEEEPDIILARIDADENGEPVYVPPTDDEYDHVVEIYDHM
ncbi:MAG TPA: DUF1292 domain-containing protein [Veillonellaceae bacterium]|jgi:uncharacterized protein YrzB (UPF0473 family)|nr:DUF1292 domain-containing protein [Veillonellaceae bacterium]